MRSEFKWTLLALVLAGLLIGIFMAVDLPEPVTKGVVYHKEFEPAHMRSTVGMAPTFGGDGISYRMTPKSQWVPDRWWLYVQDGERTAKWRVTKGEFDRFGIGDGIQRGGSNENDADDDG